MTAPATHWRATTARLRGPLFTMVDGGTVFGAPASYVVTRRMAADSPAAASATASQISEATDPDYSARHPWT